MTAPAIRENIMSALFEVASTSTPAFVTRERKVRLWGDVPDNQRPYFAMGERDEEWVGGDPGTPTRRIFNVEFYIYTTARNVDVPSAVLNPLLDAIQLALAPNILTHRFTLGDLIYHGYITGRIFKDPGDIDGDGMAIVPFKLIVP